MSFLNDKFLEKWFQLSSIEQMANIGAEVGRAINWKKKGEKNLSLNALFRALDLIDASVVDKKNKNRLKEFLRTREILVDYFVGKNVYQTSESQLEKYFYYFNFAANNIKFLC
jgi:hypothetical protein